MSSQVMNSDIETTLIKTPLGDLELGVRGQGSVVVLSLHGSPGGTDAATIMSRFLPSADFKVLAPSRHGYLGTPLGKDGTIDHEADLLAALLDTLGIRQLGVLAWSGGGPVAYRLAVRHPNRVACLVCFAAVSLPITEPPYPLSDRILFETSLGQSLFAYVVRRNPDHIIQSVLEHEGSLLEAEVKDLFKWVSSRPDQRSAVLDISLTVGRGGKRRAGFRNDMANYAKLGSLELDRVRCPVLLVHGDADNDVPIRHSLEAHKSLANSELLTLARGTHVALYAHQDAEKAQQRVRAFFATHGSDNGLS